MKRYLLDTNAIITLLNDPRSSLALRAKKHRITDIFLSSIVLYELFYGAFKSRRISTNVALVDQLPFEILAWDKEDARYAGEIRATLAEKGNVIGSYDLLIAGQALSRGMILVTHNIKEFNRIPSLKLEDWQ